MKLATVIIFALILALSALAQDVTITQPGGSAVDGSLAVYLDGPGSSCTALPEYCIGGDYLWVTVEGAAGQEYSVVLLTAQGLQTDSVTGMGTSLFAIADGDEFISVTVSAASKPKSNGQSAPHRSGSKGGRAAK